MDNITASVSLELMSFFLNSDSFTPPVEMYSALILSLPPDSPEYISGRYSESLSKNRFL